MTEGNRHDHGKRHGRELAAVARRAFSRGARAHHGPGRVHRVTPGRGAGDNVGPWIEAMAVRPQSPYAATKVAGEALLRAYSGSYGLDTVSLRYFNIFGPRQNANSAYAAVIAAFAKALLENRRPTIY